VPYLFGEDDIAAQRLQVLAEVFAESTSAFLRGATRSKLGLAIDRVFHLRPAKRGSTAFTCGWA
jgi:hypothetical protein